MALKMYCDRPIMRVSSWMESTYYLGPFHIYTEPEPKPFHRFFGRPFTYELNPWTKSKKMPVYFGQISLSDSKNTFTIPIVPCHCFKLVVFTVALGLAPQKSVICRIVLAK